MSGGLLAAMVATGAAGTAFAATSGSGAIQLGESSEKSWTKTTVTQERSIAAGGQTSAPKPEKPIPDEGEIGEQAAIPEEPMPDEGAIGERAGMPEAQGAPEDQALTIHNRIHFQVGSAELDDPAKDSLQEVASLLKDHPGAGTVKIQAFADATGPAQLNDELSEERADAVKSYLLEQGVEENRLETQGFGATQFVAPNDAPDGRAMNRRAEVSYGE